MNKDQIKQKINNHIDYRRLLWTTFIVLSGGVFTLLLNIGAKFNFFDIKTILFILGSIIDMYVLLAITEHNKKVEELILKLGE